MGPVAILGRRLRHLTVAQISGGSWTRVATRLGSPAGASEPEPDLAGIPQSAPRAHRPPTAALVADFVVLSLTRDLTDKPPIHAKAGIPTY